MLFIQLELNLALLWDVSVSSFFIQIPNFLITICWKSGCLLLPQHHFCVCTFLPLTCLYNPGSILHCLYYYSFIIILDSCKLSPPSHFFYFLSILAVLSILQFSVNFRFSLLSSTKNLFGFSLDYIDCVFQFRKFDIFKTLSPGNLCRYGLYFHVLKPLLMAANDTL